MKILLLDDHALFRAGLRLLLTTIEPHSIIFEAGNIDESLAICRQHPDLNLCLLDLALHHENGFDAIFHIKQNTEDTAIVVISANNEPEVVCACLDAGAMSIISKSAEPAILTEALLHVLRGSIYLPQNFLESSEQLNENKRPHLSPRQLEVLAGLCRGKTAKIIANELGLSNYTVREYIASLFRLLNVHNRTEAVIKANQLNLLPPQ